MALTVDKFKFGNKSITDMYFGTAPVKEIYFGNILVWQKGSAKVLVAGNQNVAIEYDMTDATSDLVLTSIEIFTDSDSTSEAKIKIIHESGLFIAAIDGDTRGSSTEKYSLPGRTRSVDNLNITLYKGHKYYFVYQGSTNAAFYPAYFQGDTDGNYKIYANTTGASQITVYPDVNSLKALIGHNENLNNTLRDEILKLNANEKFLWGGYQQQEVNPKTPAMQQGGIYNRENLTGSYAGKKTTLQGIASIPKGDYCLIDVDNTGFTNEAVYRKTDDIPSYTEFNFDSYTSLSQEEKQIMYIASLNNKTLLVTSKNSWVDYYDIRGLNKFKADYTSDIEIVNNVPTARTTEPDNPTDKCFYYLNTSTHSSGLYLYENSSWTAYYRWDTDSLINKAVDKTQITNYFTVINFSSIISFVSKPSSDLNFANQSVEVPGKHFYLKLNNSIEV